MVLERALAAGSAFLRIRRDDRGMWRDFEVAGLSDAWVTGYVGSMLAEMRVTGLADTLGGALASLRRTQWWRRGWGYNATVPADADSTTWAVRFEAALQPRASWRARRAAADLRRYLRSEGGLATYAGFEHIARFTKLPVSFDGWCAAHTCVTAAAAALTSLPFHHRLLAFLRVAQQDDGAWHGYWWSDHEYTTALAAEALADSTEPGDEQRAGRAVAWARERLRDGCIRSTTDPLGSPFATACALRLIAPRGCNDVAMRAAEWLIANQNEDGSWRSSARLRIVPPAMTEPDAYPFIVADRQGSASIGTIVRDSLSVFTTATVIAALEKLHSPS